MKTLLFSIPPRRKFISMQNCESIVPMVTSLTSSCIVMYVGMACIMLEMMMSVLQEIEGFTKELYFAEGRPVFIQNFRFYVYTVYLF